MPDPFPSFADFYAATNQGRSPFPWQMRLARQVTESEWPATVAIPTGMGKTATIDIAIWNLARQIATCDSSRRTAPTRTWYVVNRRLLVDAAFERATTIAEALRQPDSATDRLSGAQREALHAASAAMKSLGGEARPLHIARLRGSAELGQRPPSPAHPSVILATLPMFASRLLFRGYGSSVGMHPVDAALAGVDCLVLLDEAHLAEPLVRLMDAARECDFGDPAVLLPVSRARPILVELTATSRSRGERFTLNTEDRSHHAIAQRLRAPKPTYHRGTKRERRADDLAAQAREEIGLSPRSAGVIFCNAPETARRVLSALAQSTRVGQVPSLAGADVVLLTGRMREREAAVARARILDPQIGAPTDRDRAAARERPFVVVATQTLEVGADVDFDWLVTESAGRRAIVQRFGRLNRIGEIFNPRAVIVHSIDEEEHPLYNREPAEIWRTLESRTEPIDLSPEMISTVLGEPDDVPPRAAALLPDHLWEYAKTSYPEPGEPPVELFYEPIALEFDVSVCWRAHRPSGERLIPSIHQDEAVDIPIGELKKALAQADLVLRLASDRATLEEIRLDALQPGDTVVLSPDQGLYDRSGWDPDAKETVLDVAALDRGVLFLTEAAVAAMIGEAVPDVVRALLQELQPSSDVGEAPETVAASDATIDAVLEYIAAAPPHPWVESAEWSAWVDQLRSARRFTPEHGAPFLQVLRTRANTDEISDVRSEVFEELSFDTDSRTLGAHQEQVATLADSIARRAGLPEPIIRSIAIAAAHHDAGKLDLRFQRWLDPEGTSLVPVAKSGMSRSEIEPARRAAGWPRGGRHELLSARAMADFLARQKLDGIDPELILHLIASHHGEGRSWIRVVPDQFHPRVIADVEGHQISVTGDLSLMEWEQPRRFRRTCERYGAWGIALLEAILRQADHLVSGRDRGVI